MTSNAAGGSASRLSSRAVIVMAKRPAAGSTKTRLVPAFSPQEAAEFYERLLFDTIDMLTARDDCETIIAVDEPASVSYFDQSAPGLRQLPQGSGALGDRLASVLSDALELGFESVFAINSDGPDLPPEHLDAAFAQLDQPDIDVVLGPTDDGGYYLIGWRQPWSPMVTDVVMSTPDVLADTLAITEKIGARVALAPSWFDVDVPEDLDRLEQSVMGRSHSRTAAFFAAR